MKLVLESVKRVVLETSVGSDLSTAPLAPPDPPRALVTFVDPTGAVKSLAQWFLRDEHVIAFFEANVGGTFEVSPQGEPEVS